MPLEDAESHAQPRNAMAMDFSCRTPMGVAKAEADRYPELRIQKAFEACQPVLSMVAQYAALLEGN